MTLHIPARPFQIMLWLALSVVTFGQGPISDRLEITLPNTTWVGSQTLAAGKYKIRQLPTASNPRLLEFSSDNGTKLEAAVTTIATIDNNLTRETTVIVKQSGDNHYLSQVWVAGKTYGYEIPIDRGKLTARRSESVTLAANYVPAPAETASIQPPAAAPAVERTPPTPDVAPEQVATAPANPPVPAAPPAPPAENVQIAQAIPQPERTPVSDTPSQVAAQTPKMPQTASYWVELILTGSLMFGLGMFLIRRHV